MMVMVLYGISVIAFLCALGLIVKRARDAFKGSGF